MLDSPQSVVNLFPLANYDQTAECCIYCLPSAGSSASMYAAWSQAVPNWLTVKAVEYPGRGTRINEPLTHSPNQIVDDITTAIVADTRPFILFGHSLGAAIAWCIVARLKALGQLDRLILLVISGRPPPEHVERDSKRHELPREQFIDEVTKYSGLPDDIRQNTEIMDFFLPIIRNDFHMNDVLSQETPDPIDIPLLVFSGADDDDTNMPMAMQNWEKYSTRWAGHTRYPGGHFFLRETDVMKDMLSRICEHIDLRERSEITGSDTASTIAQKHYHTAKGLRVSYRIEGLAHGFPVLMLHGGVGAYPLSKPLKEIAASFSIALITINRPGFNGSDLDPEIKRLETFADIVQPLLLQEKIVKFGVIGLCAGAPFAHALANRYQDRIAGVWILSGIPDINLLEQHGLEIEEPLKQNRDISQNTPEAELGTLITQGIREFQQTVDQTSLDPSAPPAWDARYHASGILLADYLDMLQWQLQQNCLPMARECKLIYQPWGLDQTQLNLPMTFWHAKDDSEVPFSSVKAMVDLLPNATLIVQEQDSHYPSDQTMLQLFDSIQQTTNAGALTKDPA
ncbi:alpha/beta fold hydrolase [Halomonas sp. FME1]|uniref:Alpha/beta fold hydrolase n=2 Tax=Oceanospirillales TaxID=135619 RepID=A0ABR9F5I7_9GAMM|nr:alpha/beta fold hydrolase [Halomonas casei]MBE0401374.1 alpha/beta fold hydrolase [Halomonas casei]